MSMGLNSNILLPLKVYIDIFRFWINKKIWGFNKALVLFRSLQKESLIPVLKANGAIISKDCEIETGITFHNCKSFKNLRIGANCHIGKNCFFDLRDKIVIGNNVTISMQVTLITHLDIGKSNPCIIFKPKQGPLIIEDNVYIGCNTTILHNLTIGEKSIIGANSIIRKNVKKYSYGYGNPFKYINAKKKHDK